MKQKRQGLIIAGPTGSGKSAYALHIAQREKGMILNADSLQLYSGLPLLTAQPDATDRECVPHFLYEIFEPHTPLCSAQQWTAHVKEILEAQEDFKPILVGGTGFYLQALTQGLSPIPPVPLEIREAFLSSPTLELYRELTHVDPPLAARLHAHDRQRIIRGLSVWKATGKPLSMWQTQPRLPFPYPFDWKILEPDRIKLHKLLEERLNRMVFSGVFEEVRSLIDQLNDKHVHTSPLTRALGFKEIQAYWEGRLTHTEAIQKTLEKTRQYAKRQITWFKHQRF